jgi:phosphatidylserine synthase
MRVKGVKRQRPPLPAWRVWAPYAFMAMVFGAGFAALLAVLQGAWVIAGRLVLAATVVSGWEYALRRYWPGPSSLEHEFSTLGDVFCFAVVPALLLHQLAFRGWGLLGLLAVFAVVFGATIRLSLYKLYNPGPAHHGFIGLPLTVTAGFIAAVAQLLQPEAVGLAHRLGLVGATLGLTFLTVSPIPYPNPTERPAMLLGLIALTATVFAGPPWSRWAAGLLLVGGAAYILLAPWGAAKGGKVHA